MIKIKNIYTGKVIYSSKTARNKKEAVIEAVQKRISLAYADLNGASLKDADLSGATLPHFQIVPEEGSFIGWKKLANGAVAKLRIPADAKRTSNLIGRKCRAEYVFVEKIFGAPSDGGRNYPLPEGQIYKEGECVYPDKYDDDIRVECTHGIHFFVTRKEAEEW